MTKNRSLSYFLLFVFYFAGGPAHTQGMLPPKASSSQTATDTQKPLLIGDKIPPLLILADETGNKRSLLSYKSSLDIMVVVFLSTHCESNRPAWPVLSRLKEDYEGWRTSFVAVIATDKDSQAELSNIFKQERVSWPLLRDVSGKSTSWLAITTTPEILIIDEEGALRYRGPIEQTRKALDTLIGHVDPIKTPEPPMATGCAL